MICTDIRALWVEADKQNKQHFIKIMVLDTHGKDIFLFYFMLLFSEKKHEKIQISLRSSSYYQFSFFRDCFQFSKQIIFCRKERNPHNQTRTKINPLNLVFSSFLQNIIFFTEYSIFSGDDFQIWQFCLAGFILHF